MTLIIPPSPTKNTPYATMVAEDKNNLSLFTISSSDIINLYKEHGAIVLRGFKYSTDDFTKFAKQFCSSFVINESVGRILLDKKNNIQTVNKGSEPFPLHSEIAREPWKPDICFFGCLSPPQAGGETTICDGTEIVKNLPPKLVSILKTYRLEYAIPTIPEECNFWLGSSEPDDFTLQNPPANCPYTFIRHGSKIIRIYKAPTLHKPMFTDDLAFANFLLFSRFLSKNKYYPVFEGGIIIPDDIVAAIKEASDALTTAVKWQTNDLLIVDNTRFMHGRNAISNTNERMIITAFGYVNFNSLDDQGPTAIWRESNFTPPGQ
jgi:alpha-ketoglutarate-dependent taurine dioxygenase